MGRDRSTEHLYSLGDFLPAHRAVGDLLAACGTRLVPARHEHALVLLFETDLALALLALRSRPRNLDLHESVACGLLESCECFNVEASESVAACVRQLLHQQISG